MKDLIYSIIIWMSLANSVQAQYKPIQLNPAQLQQDFHILRSNLEGVHPRLYTYTAKPQFDTIFKQIEAKLNTPMTALEFFRQLMPLHQAIRNNHTKIFPPQIYVDALTSALPRLPLRLYWYQDTLFVQEDFSREEQIGVGSSITSINGEDALAVFKFIAQQLSTDGYNTSYPYTITGQAFSRLYAYFKGTPNQFVIEYKNKEGVCKTAEIAAIPFAEIMAKREQQIESQPNKDEHSFRLEKGVGVLRISSFLIDPSRNIKPRQYKELLESTFNRLQAEKIETLILDLRDNGGGFPEAADRLLRYLISETVYPSKAEYALVKSIPTPHHFQEDFFFKHFHRQALKWGGQHYQIKGVDQIKVKPSPHAFQGKLVVLINAKCASATTGLLGQIASHTEAIFVGEETGGNPVTQVASDLLTLILPNSNLKVQLPVICSEMNVNFENKGYGLRPDIPFRPRIEAVLKGEDTLLEFALGLAQSPGE